MKSIHATVIGAAGYTGKELIKLLIYHPEIKHLSLISRSQKGKKISDVCPELTGETDLCFSDILPEKTDVSFLCMDHGESEKYIKENKKLLDSKIIDLGRDFRINKNNKLNFVYGLPELNKAEIKKADYIANPGCFATCIQLGILPMANKQLLNSHITVNATTGSTGAGIKLSETSHFSWRQNNFSVYNPFDHPHNEEIIQSINKLQKKIKGDLIFIPQRGSFTRGILSTTIIESDKTEKSLIKLYKDFYKNEPFVEVLKKNIDLKMIVNTNKCFISIKKHKKHVLITSIIDNLLKGAAGQAVQNMNIMFGFDETNGLKLKSVTY